MGYFQRGTTVQVTPFAPLTTQRRTDEVTVGEDAHVVKAEINKDTNMLHLELNSTGFDQDLDYSTGFTVALSAEDANNESAESSITIKPNRAPVLQNGNGLTQTDNVLDNAVTIGTMDDKIDTDPSDMEDDFREVDTANAVCKTINSCEFDLFDDEGSMTLTAVAYPAGKLSFKDEGDGKITITGLEAHSEEIDVDVTAVDEDEQEFKFRVLVVVDAAPTISEAGQGVDRTSRLGVARHSDAKFRPIACWGLSRMRKEGISDTAAHHRESANTQSHCPMGHYRWRRSRMWPRTNDGHRARPPLGRQQAVWSVCEM